MVTTFVLASIQITSDYHEKVDYIDTQIDEILNAAQQPSTRAVHTLDGQLAQEVIDGLSHYKYIVEMKIEDETQKQLARFTRNKASYSKLAGLLFKGNKTYTIDLIVTNSFRSDEYGKLSITISRASAFTEFVNQSVSDQLFGLFKNLIILGILFYAFHILVSKPIIELSKKVDEINPNDPDANSISLEFHHADDEIMILTNATNQFLDNTNLLIQQLKDSEAQVKTSLDTVQAILNDLPSMIYLKNKKGEILIVNQRFCRFIMQSAEDLIGTSQEEFLNTYASEYKELLQNSDLKVIDSQKTQMISEIEMLNGYGKVFFLEIRNIPFKFNEEDCVLTVAQDITESKKAAEKIRHLAYHDSLTNLPNRLLFSHHFEQAMIQSNQNLVMGALIMIGLDNFKNINDSLNHQTGDNLLIQFSKRIQAHLGENDYLSRFGGDEFIICSPDIASDKNEAEMKAMEKAQYLQELLSQPYFNHGQKIYTTCSVGVAIFPGQTQFSEQMIKYANTSMQHAKEQGKDRVVLFENFMAENVIQRIQLEELLRDAITKNEFFLVFQPQIDSTNNSIIGAETLIRWNHPSKGRVSPAQFIPVLESSGLIIKVGYWVFEQSCILLSQWLKQGTWSDTQLIGINVSPQQFNDPNFVETIIEILQQTGAPARCIDIEITEGLLIDNIEDVITKMIQLKSLGIRFSIDDFGTGYSSLSYLKKLPVDVLKIDQSFIRDIPNDEQSIAIVETIVSIAQHLKLKCIAEGVETKEQLDFLTSINCNRIQGYFFSKPLEVDDFIKFINDKKSV
ncbi:sensor domain-containing protein [Marinicellulosiphila megalodicopiae]|uniref:sensor domain-containing protein n=1 Tax=Marinicellulosiphila megalodicopiae TaxID=2724896 RepID=UPI003BB1AF9D